MWRDRRLCERLGIEHPIIQAPMLGAVGPTLAAEVSKAGGLGSLACGDKGAEETEQLVARMRQLTDRPFNLNFWVHPGADAIPVPGALATALSPWADRLGVDLPETWSAPARPFGPALAEAVADLRPAAVSFHFDLPDAERIATLKAAGIVILSSAHTVASARRQVAAGVDVIIAQGWEAGGHRGAPGVTQPMDGVGTMALVPQVVDAVGVPVVAAGGIGDGRGIAAAIMLGAAGVQMGTAFLRCPESDLSDAARARLAVAADTDTAFTRAFTGGTARGLRSAYATDLARADDFVPTFPGMLGLSGPLLAAADARGDDGLRYQLYGQAAALSRAMPAGDLVTALVAEARALMQR